MSEDADLDRIMAKRMAEMMSAARQNADAPPKRTPREILVSALGHRGLEVLKCAEEQFPRQISGMVPELAKLCESGQVGTLDGATLLSIFQTLGLRVRMPTRISVERDGKTVSLSERIRYGKD